MTEKKNPNEEIVKFGGEGGETIVVHRLKAGKFYEATILFGEIIQASSKSEDMEEGLLKMFKTMPEKIIGLIAMCSDKDDTYIKENAYPEEIVEAWRLVLKLNNFVKNLGNLAAPIGQEGAIPNSQK
jgi:hypothetical protein